MSFTKQNTPAPLLREFMWHIYAQEAQEEINLLTQVVIFYLVEGGNDSCNDPEHRQRLHCLYSNLCQILEYQLHTLPPSP